jgi:hypothetical protein
MLVDWGSWDRDFNQLTASVCEQLLAIIDGSASHHCVPLQGSGTFAVEAAIGTLNELPSGREVGIEPARAGLAGGQHPFLDRRGRRGAGGSDRYGRHVGLRRSGERERVRGGRITRRW